MEEGGLLEAGCGDLELFSGGRVEERAPGGFFALYFSLFPPPRLFEGGDGAWSCWRKRGFVAIPWRLPGTTTGLTHAGQQPWRSG